MEEARDLVLKEGIVYNNERLQVSVTRDKNIGNPSELRISTTLMANNFPQRESPIAIIKVIKQVFGEDNVVDISFDNTSQGTTKQARWCHIHCLYAAVYTVWIHESIHILGRHIDFIPHHGSVDGAAPNKTAIRLAQAPIREVLADKIQAMDNATILNPLITEKHLTKTMKELDEKLGSLITNINNHTDRRHEKTTTVLTNHSTNLHALLGTIAHDFQQSNMRMQGINIGLFNAIYLEL